MSADNWAICPKCLKIAKTRVEKDKKKMDNAYGKVPSDQYLKMKENLDKLTANEDFLLEETLREDYELGIDRDGLFYITYSGKCDKCGLKYSFHHDEEVK